MCENKNVGNIKNISEYCCVNNKIAIIRPINLGIIALTILLVCIKYAGSPSAAYWIDVFKLLLPAILTAAGGYVINDMYDIETDMINKPHKAYIPNVWSVRNAKLLYAALNAASLAVSYWLSKDYLVVNACIIGMLYLYAIYLKGVPILGNLLVAMCSAAVVAVCVFVIQPVTQIGKFNFFGYIIFAFIISVIREIVKDIQDMAGDEKAGYRTYPIVAGLKGAKILIYAFIGIELLFCSIYSFLAWGVQMYASAALMTLITLSLFYLLNEVSKGKTSKDFDKVSLYLKIIIVVGVVNLILT